MEQSVGELLNVVTFAVLGKRCKIDKDCDKDECCVGFYRGKRAILYNGVCSKLGREGDSEYITTE